MINIRIQLQKTPNSQNHPEKEQSCRYHNTRFQDMLQSYISKQNGTGTKKIYIDKWNRIDSQEINTWSINQFKGGKNI